MTIPPSEESGSSMGASEDVQDKRERELKFHLLLLTLLPFCLYFPVFSYDFIFFDDQAYILENNLVKQGLTLNGLYQALLSTYASNWHPVTWISHMLDFQIFGLNAGAFHTVNALFHTANTLLLYLLFYFLTGRTTRSLFIAALFAVHPLHVESVAWISERKDLLSTFFMLLTTLLYVGYTQKRNRWYYSTAILMFLLAVMAKPTVVTLPCLLLLLDFWPLNRLHYPVSKNMLSVFFAKPEKGCSPFYLIVEKMPFFLITILSCGMTYYAQDQGFSVVPVDTLPVTVRITNAFISYIKYIQDFLFPFHLAVLYPLDKGSINFQTGIITGFLVLACTYAALRSSYTRPWLIVGWLWFLGTLFPMIGIVQVGYQARADRYTYIPLIGMEIIAVWLSAGLLKDGRSKTISLYAFGGLIITLFSALSFFQIEKWRSTTALFEDTLKNTKENYLIHTYLGAELERTGFNNRAIAEFEKAIKIRPGFPLPYNNIGMILDERGESDKARLYFKKAIALNPYLDKPYFNLGNVLFREGDLDGAELNLNKALSINPAFAAAENSVGYILFLKKKYEEAATHLKKALLLAPAFYMAYNNLGIVYAASGNKNEAMYYFNEAIKLEPENPTALQNRKKLRSSL